MNVILIRPPSILGNVGAHALQHPVGLCWLAAVLQNDGHNVAIWDYEVEPYDASRFAAAIAEAQPDVIGLTAMTPLIPAAAAMAAAARAASPAARIFIGGAHASILPVETLREFPAFDAAVVGEGEPALAALVAQVGDWGARPVPSTAVRVGDSIRDDTAPGPPLDLDTLPLPARHLLRLDRYRGASTPGIPQAVFHATVLFTSRGCAGRCIFCCARSVFGPHVRYRSPAHIIAEIRDCRDRFGFRHFTIDDDTLTLRRDHVLGFCEAVAPMDVTWDCDTRVDRVDSEIINTMARAGCRKVAFGVESGSQEILDKIKKGITLQQVRDAFRLARAAGMMTCGFFMVGNHPDETAAHIDETRRFIVAIDPDLISVAVASPYPGTELSELLRRDGLLDSVPWEAYGQSFLGKPFTRTRTLSSADLLRAQRRLLRSHFLRPSYILRRLMRLRSPADALYWFSAGFQFLRYLTARKRGATNF